MEISIIIINKKPLYQSGSDHLNEHTNEYYTKQ